jgi:hypothetical protein
MPLLSPVELRECDFTPSGAQHATLQALPCTTLHVRFRSNHRPFDNHHPFHPSPLPFFPYHGLSQIAVGQRRQAFARPQAGNNLLIHITMFSRRQFVTTRWITVEQALYPDGKSPMECTEFSFAVFKKTL